MSYQVGTVLPWWIKRYVLMQKGATCPPLYTFDGKVSNDDDFVETVRRQSKATPDSRRGSLARAVNKF